jgi:hypothetical protein
MTQKTRIQDAGQSPGNTNDRERHATGSDADRTATTTKDPAANAPGQLALDDRGNVNWQWSDDDDLNADDIVGRSARVRALAPADLKLEEDDLAELAREPIPIRHSNRSGYDPYESGEPTKQSWKKKRDLRQLGKWIELKKRMKEGGE